MKSIRARGAVLTLALLALATDSNGGDIHYVSRTNAKPSSPFLTWATAATNIQDAIDVALGGDTVLVTNGVYATGGRAVYGTMTNRVVVDKAVLVESANGPAVTVIQGYKVGAYLGVGDGAIRCAYLTNGAVLSGFTLTNGATRFGTVLEGSGGGVWGESTNVVVTNCTLVGNSAAFSAGAYGGTLNNCTLRGNSSNGGSGGGAASCSLNNCALADNSAGGHGGGADACTLNNCTLTGNGSGPGDEGGGASNCTLNNCTLMDNDAQVGGGASYCTLNNCLLMGNSAEWGGGAWRCTLTSCLLTDNSAGGGIGGGACDCALNNCTLTGNFAGGGSGGGADGGTLTNCILYYNTASFGDNYYNSTLGYCCTTPLPGTGIGNIANEPGFVNFPAGDYHLLPSSPCVNAGLNQPWMSGAEDLDGKPRVLQGRVDMGAFETSGPIPLLVGRAFRLPSNFWLQICAPAGALCVLQASTNLSNWVGITIQAVGPSGLGESIDQDAWRYSRRYYRASIQPGAASIYFPAPSGVITPPFVTANDSIYQPVSTDVANGGRAAYSFVITNAGDYVIQTIVGAPDTSANSFFAHIDAEPQDPSMVWDIPLTTGFEERAVSWRGNGSWDNDEFDPKVFNLTQGSHQLIIRGREAYVVLQSLTIIRYP